MAAASTAINTDAANARTGKTPADRPQRRHCVRTGDTEMPDTLAGHPVRRMAGTGWQTEVHITAGSYRHLPSLEFLTYQTFLPG